MATTLATMDQISSTGPKPETHYVGTPPTRRHKRDAPASSEFVASPSSFRPGWTYQSHFRDGAKGPNGEPRFLVPWDGISDGERRIYDELAKMRKGLVSEFMLLHERVEELKQGADAGPLPAVVKDQQRLKAELESMKERLSDDQNFKDMVERLTKPITAGVQDAVVRLEARDLEIETALKPLTGQEDWRQYDQACKFTVTEAAIN